MKSITDFALNNSRIVVLSMVLIVFGGVYFFTQIPKLEDPPITIREALVMAHNPGMPVEQVERLITRPIEEELRTMGEVDDIKDSTSKVGQCLIHVSIKDEVPAEELPMVWKLLRNHMNDVKQELPEGTVGPLVEDTFGDTSVATIALWSDGFSMAEMYEAARKIRERLNLLVGTKKIDMTGEQEERIYLEVSNAKIAQLGVETDSIGKALRQQNTLLPGGKLDVNGSEVVIETLGRFESLDDIGDVLIPISGTQGTVALRDIATIRKGYVEPVQNPAYYNGHPAIVLSVFLLDGVDAVVFGERLVKEVNDIEQSLPLGYKLDFAVFQPELIQKSVRGMVINVIESVAIVLVVVVLLLGLRIGLIVGSFIPLVMLFGVVMMSVFGIEMQRMSLATMIIALGMFVDNAIVITDSVKVYVEEGMTCRDAVLKTGRLLAVPLLTSTLTTVIAFGPIILQIGSVGDYTASIGSVMTMLLMGSWFFSMVTTTSMCNWFMKVPAASKDDGNPKDPYQGKFYRLYRKILEISLRHRILVIAVAGIAFVGAGLGLSKIPQAFFPNGDRNQFLVYLDLPAGTHIEKTDETVRKVCGWLQDQEANPEITGTIAYVGNGGPRFFLSLSPVDPDPFVGFIIVNTETGKQVPELVERTSRYIRESCPDVLGRVKAMWLGGSESGLLEIRLSGPGIDVLEGQAEQLMTALRDIPGTVDIKNDWYNRVFKAKVDVDQARARRAGLTSQEVANSLKFFIDGSTVTTYYPGNIEIPIVGRGVKHERETLANLATLGIYSQATGESVPLNQIADVYGIGELNRIVRYNQERTITVSAKHQHLKVPEILEQLKPSLAQMDFPAGHYWEVGGELEDSTKAQKNLAKWLPACLGGMIFLLVGQFNSMRRAAVILLTIPLILVGAVIGLTVMRADFGFMVILGLLALAGSIVNNGIVMIDRIEENRKAGQSDYDAVVNSAVSRLRPILLSVSTTMLGFSPLIINHDPLFFGMACVMFFGLGIGSMFTLNYVPALYAILFRIKSPTKNKP